MNTKSKNIRCPLSNSYIDEYSCYLICEAAEGMLPKSEMVGIKPFEQERDICINCKYHNVE